MKILRWINSDESYKFNDGKTDEDWAGCFCSSSWHKPATGHLYHLTDFDHELVKDYKDSKGGIIFRYETDIMFGHMKPLIKINITNGLIYFLKDTDEDVVEFQTKGVKARWINLVNVAGL
tara:strand:+ start:267 stop:626 length:360 start_codon:yes stop_codon:yes gene_type:complete